MHKVLPSGDDLLPKSREVLEWALVWESGRLKFLAAPTCGRPIVRDERPGASGVRRRSKYQLLPLFFIFPESGGRTRIRGMDAQGEFPRCRRVKYITK